MNEATQSGIEVAVSNPCFELWLVLHAHDQTAYVDRRDVQRRSTDLELTSGKHIANAAARHMLIDLFETAKRRAKALDRRHQGNGSPPRSNPSTDVWRLVDRLRTVGSS